MPYFGSFHYFKFSHKWHNFITFTGNGHCRFRTALGISLTMLKKKCISDSSLLKCFTGHNIGNLVMWLCCCEVCFRMGLLSRLQWYSITLTLIMVVASLANTIWCKNAENIWKPGTPDTHMRVIIESYPMNTNTTGFK